MMLVFFVVITASMNAVQAGTATDAGLWLTDQYGNIKNDFVLNQVVYVNWITTGGTVDITVTDANNVVVYSVTDKLASDSPLQFTPLHGGSYTVSCTGAESKEISVWTLFVVPESVLGTLMATGAGFSAFGTLGVFKLKRAKTKVS
jgi:hypothetical protein